MCNNRNCTILLLIPSQKLTMLLLFQGRSEKILIICANLEKNDKLKSNFFFEKLMVYSGKINVSREISPF